MMKIYHNNRCSKSRCALDIIDEKHLNVEVVKYLEDVPTKNELKELLKKLDMKAADLVRKSEPVYKELYKGKNLTEAQWIDAMIKHPILIERPIFVNGNKAVIGRPPERILEIM